MRLLKIDENCEFSLAEDIINNTYLYAILSHTWGDDDDDEVNIKDLMEGSSKTKAGYRKASVLRTASFLRQPTILSGGHLPH